jgi:hypothetical protein
MSKVKLILSILIVLGILSSFLFITVPVYAADAYWVGGSGDWQDATNHWASVSGGSPNVANLPDGTTNVHFDVNSFSSGSQTVTFAGFTCNNMDWTSSTNTPTLDVTDNGNLTINGDCTFISGMAITGNQWLVLAGSGTLTTNTLTIPLDIEFQGSYALGDDLVTEGSITLENDFDSQGFDITDQYQFDYEEDVTAYTR